MIHTIISASSGTGQGLLTAMFIARKQVFVDLLKWDVPVLDGQYEIDQFDDDHAVYLIVTNAQGDHLASARLLQTTRPHILGTLFPHLCEEAVPSSPDVLEITRFCLARGISAAARRQARNELVSAIALFGIDHGISHFTAVAEVAWMSQILAFGWCCLPLGLPQADGADLICALQIAIEHDTLDRLAAQGIYTADTLSRAAERRAA